MRYDSQTHRMSDIRLAYIGGGSRGWAWSFMTDLAMEPSMSGEVALYDIDRGAAQANEIIGNQIGCGPAARGRWRYRVADTLEQALAGADFVVISILPGTFDEMEVDVHLHLVKGARQDGDDHEVRPREGLLQGVRHPVTPPPPGGGAAADLVSDDLVGLGRPPVDVVQRHLAAHGRLHGQVGHKAPRPAPGPAPDVGQADIAHPMGLTVIPHGASLLKACRTAAGGTPGPARRCRWWCSPGWRGRRACAP